MGCPAQQVHRITVFYPHVGQPFAEYSHPRDGAILDIALDAVDVYVLEIFPATIGSMSKSKASKKSLPVALGGLAIVAGASYFGFDLGGNEDATSTDETCAISSLPSEAEETAGDILAGGPYDYPDNDNSHFGNYEGVLPQQAQDYYREYTVETPGSNHRGSRRIVTGGGTETDPDVWYYTDDHYQTFCSIPDAED